MIFHHVIQWTPILTGIIGLIFGTLGTLWVQTVMFKKQKKYDQDKSERENLVLVQRNFNQISKTIISIKHFIDKEHFQNDENLTVNQLNFSINKLISEMKSFLFECESLNLSKQRNARCGIISSYILKLEMVPIADFSLSTQERISKDLQAIEDTLEKFRINSRLKKKTLYQRLRRQLRNHRTT